ncbi:MAG: hypothetical protein ACYC3P_09255 [Bellilinea sp.]
MNDRKYYSVRTGKNLNTRFSLDFLCKLFFDLYSSFVDKDYFQESMGYWCVDRDVVPGTLGKNIEGKIFRLLRKDNLWPISDNYQNYAEDDLFDMIEFLYDQISKPIDTGGDYHSYSNCGYHYSLFDKESGRKEFRSEVNVLLKDYGEGFELSDIGEILFIGEPGLENLLNAKISTDDPINIDDKVIAAVQKYRRVKSTSRERKDAIRDLADVLEYIRQKAEKYLESQDERDLFNLANNFGIRHHNQKQKTNYDNSIWYAWMFYYYLATIHALTLMAMREETF